MLPTLSHMRHWTLLLFSPALLLLRDGVDELVLVQHALRRLDGGQDRHAQHEHARQYCGSVLGVDSWGLYRCWHGGIY